MAGQSRLSSPHGECCRSAPTLALLLEHCDLHSNILATPQALFCRSPNRTCVARLEHTGPGIMRCSTFGPQCATSGGGRPSALVVRAAGGKQRGGGSGGGGKQRRGGKQQQQQEQQSSKQPTTRSKTLLMTEFKADEIIMFDPVPASRGALQVGVPASLPIACRRGARQNVHSHPFL